MERYNGFLKNKKAAMEMSIGTIVTIVLIVAFMIVGIYFVSVIRQTGSRAIDGINEGIQNEINELFSDDSSKKIIIYPPTRRISIQKGRDDLGFGFSIRNVEQEEGKFSYEVSAVETSCDMTLSKADELISLGKERTNILLAPGSLMEDAIFVRFNIPETAPPCDIRYTITVYLGSKSGNVYGNPVDVDLEIISA